ncbi:hypothetical protein PSU20_20705, partial [Yersinia pestis]|nr:hypothetical protein [Yersinia pestis]
LIRAQEELPILTGVKRKDPIRTREAKSSRLALKWAPPFHHKLRFNVSYSSVEEYEAYLHVEFSSQNKFFSGVLGPRLRKTLQKSLGKFRLHL